ncbi:tRNA (5-methylaminomethyl-2-thiouridine)(34)-methyltransferase MnmD [Amylibacter sp. IMCC11727]|uniref:tRNA (5-methylaminomethyl-2-thiouridine)(34)-methyltransferase MnmD n=1 Tax=Amylibacter sp. IMCC11727 TaxID=3039851 RepID=UPI00244E2524|nr:tRNA (5-methylaminomethyl-2-thiouridine)(34)-methyltransferase MnmD [Amylibacter sp. IMCC11727]WGI22346.1 tRNA (5-methylaminomethyl-2-thiouridine)(34)-methyltransferase MnmD [Amylibacter sp. IMCC11727]
MSDQNEYAALEWRDGKIPIATRFDDPYFSLDNGMAETEYVFLAGNGLPDRFGTGFHIAELGFGSGLNLLCAWKAWRSAGQTSALRFTSFEAFPMAPADMAAAQGAWPELADEVAEFAQIWDAAAGRAICDTLDARVIYGDARVTLANWDGVADAWFLDGFSPAKNPELWEPDLMGAVGKHTAVGGTFATYTAAGHVRQSLAAAGFDVERIKGFGRKRHMTRGVLA